MEAMFAKRMEDALLDKGGSASGDKPMVAKTLRESLVDQVGSFSKAQEIIKERIVPRFAKDLGAVDFGALRMVSVSERVSVVKNSTTKFLNYLETKTQPTIEDYQYKIIERNVNRSGSQVWNIEGTLPNVVQSKYTTRYNTLTCIGDRLKQSLFSQSMLRQQTGINEFERQVEDEINEMRRQMSSMLLSNEEQILEAVPNVPQLGGFLNRSDVNTVNLGGANFTNTTIQNAVNTIATTLGDNIEGRLVVWCNPSQIPVIRDLMINRFPGQSSTDMRGLMDDLRAQTLAAAGIPTQVVYEAYPGGAIPFIFDRQMPANTAIMFLDDAQDGPRMARFKFDGGVGPYILARPEVTLFEVVVVFDLFTLDDPLKVGRIKFTNVGS